MMVGEHDWYLDMGEKWRSLFGKDTYSFDHKGVHFVVLNSVIVEDYWSGPELTPMERMLAMAQLDNPNGRPFTVGAAQRDWLKNDLAKLKPETPLIVFSHSPLYKIYKTWNFWTDDAEQVQTLLAPFKTVTVIHGHTHQMLSNRIGNIHFHGMLSTAWPWPYAPQGLPKLTVRMNRADPFDEFDGCGDGFVDVLEAGHVDKQLQPLEPQPRQGERGLPRLGRRHRPARHRDRRQLLGRRSCHGHEDDPQSRSLGAALAAALLFPVARANDDTTRVALRRPERDDDPGPQGRARCCRRSGRARWRPT